ncbi:B12-binding domain-containing radical SAM protein [bacterium]|nr:B12-binding domain-containing radical SAM protein [bacterium]
MKSSTDVLFINPGNHKKTYQGLSKEFTAIAPPVWTSLLANYIRKEGYSAAIYDVNVEGWDNGKVKEIIAGYNPNLVVMMVYGHHPSASTQTIPSAGQIARDIKIYNRDIPVAMGGTHPSALPERTLGEEDIDFVIQGEGVYTIKGLADWTKGKRDIKKIKGLWCKNGNLTSFTTPPPVVENLDDELDNYAWDLLPEINNYRAHNWHCFQEFEKSRQDDFLDVRTPYIAMNTSLGCPYSCNYCCINAIFGKPRIRYWSLDRVFLWIDTLVNRYKVKSIRFDDELLILSSKRMERFCDMLIERSYDLNLFAYGRVDTIQEKLLGKLKKAGVNWICLGIESANEKVRAGVNKKIKKDIKEVVRMIQSNNINVLGNYMFGLPDDNLETMEETLQLAMELNCEFANFYSVMAYPGSALYEWASNKNGYLPKSWGAFSQHSYETQPLPTKYLPAKDVLKFRDEAYLRYFENPRYLKHAKDKFGQKVESHIQKMTQIKLKRKLLEENLC